MGLTKIEEKDNPKYKKFLNYFTRKLENINSYYYILVNKTN